jgi:hypothetical protein
MVVAGGLTFNFYVGHLLFHHDILSFYDCCNNIHYQMNQIYILMNLTIHNVSKDFGNKKALDDINLL